MILKVCLITLSFSNFLIQNRQLKVTPCGHVMFYVYLDGIRKTFIAKLNTEHVKLFRFYIN